jgi:hypothetical protein
MIGCDDIVNGIVDTPTETDEYEFSAGEGERVSIALESRRVSANFTPYWTISVRDCTGKNKGAGEDGIRRRHGRLRLFHVVVVQRAVLVRFHPRAKLLGGGSLVVVDGGLPSIPDDLT